MPSAIKRQNKPFLIELGLSMEVDKMKCCLCKKEIEKKYTPEGKMYWDNGNDAQPLKDGRCCDNCDETRVIPERLRRRWV